MGLRGEVVRVDAIAGQAGGYDVGVRLLTGRNRSGFALRRLSNS